MRKLIPLAAATLALAMAGSAQAKPPVWVIRDADSTITLFGSVHLLPEGSDWQPDALKAAVARADDLWFEVPFDDAARLAGSQALTMRGMLPEGQRLTAMMKPADVERLTRIATALNLSVGAIEPMRPWMADLAITQAFVTMRGARQSAGVELVLEGEAPDSAKRRAFETPDQQIEILAGATQADQLASLSETLRSIEEEPETFDDIVDYWMRADMGGLVVEALDVLRKTTPDSYERMITQRNAAWAPMIIERLAGSGDTVMVVGVGHLIGPDSVPAMLRARGVRVEGP